MTVRELIEQLSAMPEDLRVSIMTEIEGPPRLQVEAWVTDTAMPTSYRFEEQKGVPSYAVIIGHQWDAK